MRTSKLYTHEAALVDEFNPDSGLPAIGNAKDPPKLWKAETVKLERLPEPVIEWSLFERPGPVERSSEGCLAEFVRLANETDGDQDVRNFVKRYGALSCFPKCLGKPTEHEQRYREAVSWYRFYARRIRTVLEAAIAHSGGGDYGRPQALPIQSWQHIGIPYDVGVIAAKTKVEPLEALHNIANQRRAIENLVTDWLNEAAAQPRLKYTGTGHAGLILDVDRQSRQYPCMWKHAFDDLIVPLENTRWKPFPSIMYCVLGIQLASYVTSPYGVRPCKCCGRPFGVGDHRNLYCSEECRETVRKESQHSTYTKRRQRMTDGK